jgi:enoyl-CoA hydratase/carnithine racemase
LGRRFTAEQGLALGLIAEVTTPTNLEERALAMACELLAIPFTALKYTKQQINRSFDPDPTTLLDEMAGAEENCLRSPEHIQAMASYREELAQRHKKM